MYDGAWLKNGVFTAGGKMVASRTRLRASLSSTWIDCPKPRTAALAPT